MKRGASLALAIAAGYVLGRRRRLRLAGGLAIAAATGRLGGGPGTLFKHGTEMLGSSPELSRLGRLGGPLATAGKAAAVAAMSSRIRSISDRLNEQTEALRTAGRPGTEEEGGRHNGTEEQAGEDRAGEEQAGEDRAGEEQAGEDVGVAEVGAEARPPRRAPRPRPAAGAPVPRRAR